MENRSGCLAAPMKFGSGAATGEVSTPEAKQTHQHGANRADSTEVSPSVEIFAMPGHGRTCFLWATVFMLRQLSRVWPGYLCWPLDETTGQSLLDVHEHLRDGKLPHQQSNEETGKPAPRYALHLRNLNPWGERYFVVRDGCDPVFTTEKDGQDPSDSAVDWNRPAFWLLSLSDLDDVQGRFLDLDLDHLVRVRHASGEAAREYAFRLVVVLTKGDAIAALPSELRSLLRGDPLAKAVFNGTGDPFSVHDEIDLSAAPVSLHSYPEGDPVDAYFRVRRSIDELIRDWFGSFSSGRGLLSRAEDLGVEMRFSVVSATGSGVVGDTGLATPWTPRRILDPYFWSLEMGA